MIDRDALGGRIDGAAPLPSDGTGEWRLDDALERRLDTLVRPTLFVEPPADLQASLLASVLRAADALDAEHARPDEPSVVGIPVVPGLSAWAYAAVAALIAVYLAVVGPLGGSASSLDWLPVLLEQLGAAAGVDWDGSPGGLLVAILQELADSAPWVALLPVLWLLWERDRTVAQRQ